MTDQMTPFAFDDQLVRTHVDENGDPWFVAKDVCAILGTETRDIPTVLDRDEQKPIVDTIHTLNDNSGLRKDSRIISESGLYSLIFRSRKPQAKVFQGSMEACYA